MAHPLLEGRGAVVTGAGHGIGAALARRLAAEGARVVVNDLNSDAAHRVAEEIGGRAAAGDCASEHGVRELMAEAEQALGRVDIFMANAGIDSFGASGNGLDAPEETWARLNEVNVMAHVRAARALVPQWLAGDGGRFVVTASAAGLLTMLGSAPYSVTKHAAVGFAEWLSATYGHRGIAVQAICPQGVDTRMLADAGALKSILTAETVLSPEDVAQAWIDSLDEENFLVLPHPEVGDYYRARAGDTDRWLRGMRRLQGHLDDARSGAARPDEAAVGAAADPTPEENS